MASIWPYFVDFPSILHRNLAQESWSWKKWVAGKKSCLQPPPPPTPKRYLGTRGKRGSVGCWAGLILNLPKKAKSRWGETNSSAIILLPKPPIPQKHCFFEKSRYSLILISSDPLPFAPTVDNGVLISCRIARQICMFCEMLKVGMITQPLGHNQYHFPLGNACNKRQISNSQYNCGPIPKWSDSEAGQISPNTKESLW